MGLRGKIIRNFFRWFRERNPDVVIDDALKKSIIDDALVHYDKLVADRQARKQAMKNRPQRDIVYFYDFDYHFDLKIFKCGCAGKEPCKYILRVPNRCNVCFALMPCNCCDIPGYPQVSSYYNDFKPIVYCQQAKQQKK